MFPISHIKSNLWWLRLHSSDGPWQLMPYCNKYKNFSLDDKGNPINFTNTSSHSGAVLYHNH